MLHQLPEESELGQMVKDMRVLAGLTQEELSRKIGCKLNTLKYLEKIQRYDRGEKKATYGRHGSRISLIIVRNCLRAFGIELVMATSKDFMPVYPKVGVDKKWRITDHERSIAEMYNSGLSKWAISERLGIPRIEITKLLASPRVADYVNFLKLQSLHVSIHAGRYLLIEQSGILKENHLKKVKRLAQTRHNLTTKRRPRAKRKAKKQKPKPSPPSPPASPPPSPPAESSPGASNP